MGGRKEAEFRGKVVWFSFAFSMLVIWVHAYNAELFLGQTLTMAAVYRAEHRLGDWIAQIAVPGFFMISGYLFYRDFTWEKLMEKWNRRIGSVLVPYILWNFLYYLGYVIGSRLPWVRDVMGKGVIPWSVNAAVDAVINHTYNYVFWYLFQLILLILLAPALYPVLRRVWSRALFFIVLVWILFLDIRLPYLNTDALLYYAAAASAALAPKARRWVEHGGNAGREDGKTERRKGKPQKPRTCVRGQEGSAVCQTISVGVGECVKARENLSQRMGVCGCLMIVCAAVVYYFGLSHALPACFVLCRLFAVSGLWMAVPAAKLPPVRDFMRCSFFLYATHFAVVRFINKAGAEVLPRTPAVAFTLFLLMPVLALLVCTAAGKGLRKVSPSVWLLLNGGR